VWCCSISASSSLRIPMKAYIETLRALLVLVARASLTRFSNSSFTRCSFVGATKPLIMSRRRVSIWSGLGSPSSARDCTNVTRNFPLTMLVGLNGSLRRSADSSYLKSVIIPQMEQFRPQLLIISGTSQHVHPSIHSSIVLNSSKK